MKGRFVPRKKTAEVDRIHHIGEILAVRLNPHIQPLRFYRSAPADALICKVG